VQIKHNPTELIDFSIQPIMFLLLFTYVFGGAIAGSTSDYLTFALPGIIVQNALFATLNTGVGLNNDMTKGVFDRLRSLPIARWAPLTGRIVADVVKQAWAVALLLGLGAIMGFRVGTDVSGVLGAFGLLLLFALAFSWISVLVSMLVSEPEKVMMFGFAVMFPLTFVSNVFVPTNTMPGWLQGWVHVNPVTILANAIRGLLVGGPVATPVLQTLAWAVGILAVFGPLAVRAFRKRST
jgi:ABC transporter DrrB family efflux protein